MLRRSTRTLRLTALLGALAIAFGPLAHGVLASTMTMGGGLRVSRAEAATMAEPLEMTIEVSYKGFNSQKGLAINASEGQEVRLHFVWADKAVPDNSHRVLIKGYNLRTPLLTPDSPSATLSFTADRVGSFEFGCDWRCEGHDNIQGVFKAGAAAGGAAATAVATTVTVDQQAGEDGKAWRFTAVLRDASGDPLANATLSFSVEKEFVGVAGRADIGTLMTDKDGKAVTTYVPAKAGRQQVYASFPGLGRYAPSEAMTEIDVQTARTFVVEPKGLTPLRTWAPFGLALVVAGVWLTIGYVVFNIVAVYRKRPAGGTPMR